MSKKKFLNLLDKEYLVMSGSHYSGEIGYSTEVIDSKQFGLMVKLELSEKDVWFKFSELKEI